MNSKLQLLVGLGVVCLIGFGGYYTYSESKANLELERKIKQAQVEEFEKQVSKLKRLKDTFRKTFTDMKISEKTLSNEKISSLEDRSYVYTKLSDLKADVLACSIKGYRYNNNKTNMSEYENLVDKFDDLYTALSELDEKALNAKILNMRKIDDEIRHDSESRQKAQQEQLKHRREIEILEEKRKSEVDIYNAKLNVEKAKFESLCKAIQSSDKGVQSTFNIKTTISED